MLVGYLFEEFADLGQAAIFMGRIGFLLGRLILGLFEDGFVDVVLEVGDGLLLRHEAVEEGH